ncbi:MAG: histidine phosphatase family protein [Candidatus Aenigmarchaeota archaeon]|nr:histidine phosphatase family protein [Candidatus Aenigmarchaeota archaeon]
MNNTIIFLRHAETQKDKDTPVSKWHLTNDGKERAESLSKTGIFNDVDIIISSSEKKAYDTALPFAKQLGKEIIQIAELGEIDRDKGTLLTQEEYDTMKVRIFEDLDYTAYGWETARHALERFKSAVEKIDKEYEGKKILIVSHGTVMALYRAYLEKRLNDIFSVWKSLGFCDWYVVMDDKIKNAIH